MSAQRTTREPAFYYQFAPCYNEITDLYGIYKLNVLEAKIECDQRSKHFEATEASMNANPASLGSANWEGFRRRVERLNLDLSRIRVLGGELESKIQFITHKTLSFFQDILDDFSDGILSKERFEEYIEKYKNIIQGGSQIGLECWKKPPFDRIVKSIQTNYPAGIAV